MHSTKKQMNPISAGIACTVMRACIAFLCTSFLASGWAGVFSISPVRIHITPKDRAVALTITNEGDTAIALQADLNAWSQNANGADQLALTEDLILSPPIIKLAPRGKQVVRLASLRQADPVKQLTYRLIITEIPDGPNAKSTAVRVPVALAFSIPVFITPPDSSKNVSCRLGGKPGTISAICSNTGNAYAQIREIQLTQANKVIANFEGGIYLLPGAIKSIPLKSDLFAAAGTMQLAVNYDDVNGQVFEVALP
jgi:fimbrial chaperone protein